MKEKEELSRMFGERLNQFEVPKDVQNGLIDDMLAYFASPRKQKSGTFVFSPELAKDKGNTNPT